MIKSDNKCYDFILYVHKKMIYSHIYPSIYEVSVQMIIDVNYRLITLF